ncbi:salicylate carboxymethyltransferase-like isoform X1 [Pistacia vera]|uniref:salicylate carboxymethyltransferase-like isoform X1 n=1 Tax=Pistacia vera TaxID=55513 RepID=UPI001262C033|nr:salicylate carboxymethyltransferase-like isoform X1 [Pistacia vera]
MDVEKLFHMTGGAGPSSYAKNSSLQKKASDMVKNVTIETLQQLYLEITTKTLCIADLGCSSGSNTLAMIKDVVETVEGTCRKFMLSDPEFHVYLNDLSTNDFNSIFKALPDFVRELREERSGGSPHIYIGGYPGSFYGRLFPNNSLHLIYSSYSVHWLSKGQAPCKLDHACIKYHYVMQVPPALYNDHGDSINKGNIYISESSPPRVLHAYFNQFQEDFSTFLRSRSEELVVGGRMVLILLGRAGPDHVDRGNSFFWELLSRSLAILASQGEIEKEKLESYDVNFYAPSKDEIEEEVRREGSFKLDQLQMFHIKKEDYGDRHGYAVAATVRAIQESMIRHHFGVGEGSLDSLFEIYGRMVDEEMGKEEIKPWTFVLVLRKL